MTKPSEETPKSAYEEARTFLSDIQGEPLTSDNCAKLIKILRETPQLILYQGPHNDDSNDVTYAVARKAHLNETLLVLKRSELPEEYVSKIEQLCEEFRQSM